MIEPLTIEEISDGQQVDQVLPIDTRRLQITHGIQRHLQRYHRSLGTQQMTRSHSGWSRVRPIYRLPTTGLKTRRALMADQRGPRKTATGTARLRYLPKPRSTIRVNESVNRVRGLPWRDLSTHRVGHVLCRLPICPSLDYHPSCMCQDGVQTRKGCHAQTEQ